MGLLPGFNEKFDSDERIDGREIHQSVNLDKPVLNPIMRELGESSENPSSWENMPVTEFRGGLSVENSETRSLSPTEPGQNTLCGNLDLSLRLSLPKPSPSPAVELLISGGSVLPLSARSGMSLGVSAREELSSFGSPDIPPLILKGCPRCYMHVMVPKTDQKCPRCGSYRLV